MKIGIAERICCLSVGGLDPTGGAGIIADVHTFDRLGVWGTAVITLVAAQSNSRVKVVKAVSPELLAQQLEEVFTDYSFQGVKIGALGTRQNVKVVSQFLKEVEPFPLVIDPIFQSRDGVALLEKSAVKLFIESLFSRATLLTPNLDEAEVLTGIRIKGKIEMEKAVTELLKMGAYAVLLKGGHLAGLPYDLYGQGGKLVWLKPFRRVRAKIHGIGCVLSSAITAYLAQGFSCQQAIEKARSFVFQEILHSRKLPHWKYRILFFRLDRRFESCI